MLEGGASDGQSWGLRGDLEWGLRALSQRRVPIQERANRARPVWRPTYSRHPLEEVCFRTLLHPLRSRGDGTAPHKSNGHLKNSHLVPGYPLKSTTTATTTMREVSFSRGEPFPRRLLNGNTSSAPVPNSRKPEDHRKTPHN